ncbi:hypothetical protein GXW74_08575 [Roseomonas eburnea]|uniref:Uncharacterized protein n=1 Tax=Neoroseomonas eburnea TaxID=1346889 RepID=A0A9X9XA03_9PROT|nr:hypothetical protein [Neoroseomonas eburnea]MBR0680539.1 hypothetical protein [Neoroseomonas eburnea]
MAPIETEPGWPRLPLNGASPAGLLTPGIAAVLSRIRTPLLLLALVWEGGAGYGPVPWLPTAVALVATAGRG